MKTVVKPASGDGKIPLEKESEPEPPTGQVLVAVEAAGIVGAARRGRSVVLLGIPGEARGPAAAHSIGAEETLCVEVAC